MRPWVIALVLIPVIDQGVKHLLRRRLGSRTMMLGPYVSLRMTIAQLWLTRVVGRSSLVLMWTVWALAAGALGGVSALLPACAPFAGLLLGGSLSHGLETSLRGTVSDYISLRWWPAFNLADVAITVGALGILIHVSFAARAALS